MPKPKHLYPLPAGRDPDELRKPIPGTERLAAVIDAEIRATHTATEAAFARWRAGVGDARAPQLLWDCWTQNKIRTRTLRKHIGSIWQTSDIPDYWLTHDQWRQLFRAAGYTHVRYGSAGPGLISHEQGEPATPPTRAIRVYRGAIRERRDDWSWTASPHIAARWASGRQYGRPRSTVWTTTAPPDHVLCRIERWDQYVIDTHGLTITEHKENPR
ncbi:hypothetical protein [Streptomyces glomeratus]|uniref:Transposase n=1 Tax=Streptomyces glomeratus TaxID=284452 RepID=A0ABP6L9P2_9ACTN|nr:hypothetical protein [Streptomyces glomeratus]MCF1507047.1 hypothetical protein [Streptomyces glomeratus]